MPHRVNFEDLKKQLTSQELAQYQRLVRPINDYQSEASFNDRIGLVITNSASLPQPFQQKLWDILITAKPIEMLPALVGTSAQDMAIKSYFEYSPETLARYYMAAKDDTRESTPEEKKVFSLINDDIGKAAIRLTPFEYETSYKELKGYKPFDWNSLTDVELATAAAYAGPYEVIKNMGSISQRSNFKSIMIEAALQSPDTFVTELSNYPSIPYKNDILAAAYEKNSELIMSSYDEIMKTPELREKFITIDKLTESAKRNSENFSAIVKLLPDDAFKDSLMGNIAAKASSIYLFGWQSPDFVAKKEYLETAVRNSPMSAYLYAEGGTERTPEEYKQIKDLAKSSMQGYLDRKMDEPINDDDIFDNNINYELNERHEMVSAKRFDPVSELNAGGYYQLLTSPQDPFTSTYNFLYERFNQELSKEKKTFMDFIKENPHRLEKLPVFIERMSTFGTFDGFLGKLDADQKETLTKNVIDQIKVDPVNIITAGNYINNLKPRDPALALVESSIIGEYTDTSGELHDAFGTLGRWYAEKSRHTPTPDNSAAFNVIQKNDRYQTPDFNRVESAKLFDGANRNFQMHIFYDDEDAHLNYDNYRNNMKRDGWKLEENTEKRFAHFSKTLNGNQIQIYASIPQENGFNKNDEAVESIKNEIAAQNGKITVIAHRGHSNYVENTIPHMGPDAEITFLGSCGGTVYLQDTLDKSPHTDIIATSGIGARNVNEPLLKAINDRIFSGRDVIWDEIKAVRDAIPDERAEKYMMPPENIAAIFINKLNRLKKDDLTLSENNLNQRDNVVAPGLTSQAAFSTAASGTSSARQITIPLSPTPVLAAVPS